MRPIPVVFVLAGDTHVSPGVWVDNVEAGAIVIPRLASGPESAGWSWSTEFDDDDGGEPYPRLWDQMKPIVVPWSALIVVSSPPYDLVDLHQEAVRVVYGINRSRPRRRRKKTVA